jgi:hypothetical protein
MTDLDFSDLPPNIQHLHRVQQGDPLDLPPDDHIESPNFWTSINHDSIIFATKHLKSTVPTLPTALLLAPIHYPEESISPVSKIQPVHSLYVLPLVLPLVLLDVNILELTSIISTKRLYTQSTKQVNRLLPYTPTTLHLLPSISLSNLFLIRRIWKNSFKNMALTIYYYPLPTPTLLLTNSFLNMTPLLLFINYYTRHLLLLLIPSNMNIAFILYKVKQ